MNDYSWIAWLLIGAFVGAGVVCVGCFVSMAAVRPPPRPEPRYPHILN